MKLAKMIRRYFWVGEKGTSVNFILMELEEGVNIMW